MFVNSLVEGANCELSYKLYCSCSKAARVDTKLLHVNIKGMYYCPIEIIKVLTDKGQFQYLTKLKGLKWGITCIQHNLFH